MMTTNGRGLDRHACASTPGCLQGSQQLEAPATARTLRVRDGIDRITDGPFVETREFLAGFNLIEADSMDEAMEIARQFPWARFGSIEVRPVRDMQAVRDRVDARAQAGRHEPGPETEVAGPARCAENRVPQGETIRTGGPR